MSEQATSKPEKRGKRPQNFHRSKRAYTLDVAAVIRYTEEEAEIEFTRLRFADSCGRPKCPKCACESTNTVRRWNPGHTICRTIFKCKMCGSQFTATSGTSLAYRKLSFSKIMIAIAIFVRANVGVSALEIFDWIKCDYRTAHLLCHRFREAMQNDLNEGRAPFEGEVESDVMEAGGRLRPKNQRREKDEANSGKTKKNDWAYPYRGPKKKYVLVVAQRGHNGAVAMRASNTKATAARFAVETVSHHATIFTDCGGEFENVVDRIADHRRVNHSKCFWTGEANTNTAESINAYLRRVERGPYRHIFHDTYVQLYLDESAWRLSHRHTVTQLKHEQLVRAIGSLAHSRFRGFYQGGKAC